MCISLYMQVWAILPSNEYPDRKIMDYGPSGSSIHGNSGKNTGVGCHELFHDLGIELRSPSLVGRLLTTIATWEARFKKKKITI